MPFLDINGRRLHYIDKGKGYPILFGHSFLWDSAMWAPQIEALSAHYRCLAVDLWDHGQSDHVGVEHYTLKQLAADYWHFMQALGLDEFAIVGLSVGGMWGTQLTLDHPDAVSALVIMDTYVGVEPKVTKEKYFGMLDMMRESKCIPAPLADAIAPLFFSPKTAVNNPQMLQDLKARLMAIKSENIPGIVTLGKMIFTRECLLDHLAKIQQNTLVVCGADDIPRPPREAEEMAKRLSHAKVVIIEDAGHIANLEQPEKATALLQGFLEEHIVNDVASSFCFCP
ncbi:MAG: beta-ketoadipate enol-lactone hydrolase [Gammaproteobacteria bacterium]|jgi:pimeloyl-ACP methyl ester carboxylesterase|nr:beta-ketoadipate enol-lactone hydrolase [Gammaproteobacteria bacterium]